MQATFPTLSLNCAPRPPKPSWFGDKSAHAIICIQLGGVTVWQMVLHLDALMYLSDVTLYSAIAAESVVAYLKQVGLRLLLLVDRPTNRVSNSPDNLTHITFVKWIMVWLVKIRLINIVKVCFALVSNKCHLSLMRVSDDPFCSYCSETYVESASH